MADRPAMMAAMQGVARACAPLPMEGRFTVLMAVLAQEVCTLPPGDRRECLAALVAELPDVLDATERGMREALRDNARRGL